MEDGNCFICRVRIGGIDTFVLWYTNERDGLLCDAAGLLLSAGTRDDIIAAAAARGVACASSEPFEYDFDHIRDWCYLPRADGVDCPAFLNAWNFLDDLAGLSENPGTRFAELSRMAGHSYDKLFWGNNLPAVTPSGEQFDPSWEPEEIEEIRRVMEAGLALLRERLGGA